MTPLDLLWCMVFPCLPASEPPVRLTGIATTYWRGDGSSGAKLGCTAAAIRLFGHNRFSDDLPVIATRDGPRCGTLVTVENIRTGLRTRAWKCDAGPWGCRLDGRRVVVGPRQCVQRGGRRLATVDLAKSVADRVRADGWEPVRVRW